MDLHGIRFFANAITGDFMENEKTILLLALLILWVQTIALLESLIYQARL
jgi:hypothetical protein